jgi:hypothetical protein
MTPHALPEQQTGMNKAVQPIAGTLNAALQHVAHVQFTAVPVASVWAMGRAARPNRAAPSAMPEGWLEPQVWVTE